MDFLNKKTDHPKTKYFLSGSVVLFLSLISVDISGQKSTQLIQPSKQEPIELEAGTLSDYTIQPNEIFQKIGFIKGHLVKMKTNSPVSFADITSSDKTLFAKSNSKGEFLLSPRISDYSQNKEIRL
jgi:hypothetical protein